MQLKNTGNISKVEENRKKQEEIVRQKVFNGSRPASHHDNNSTTKNFTKYRSGGDHEGEHDLDAPISKMVDSFLKKEAAEDEENDEDDDDDSGGLGDMLRSLLVGSIETSGKNNTNTKTNTHNNRKVPP